MSEAQDKEEPTATVELNKEDFQPGLEIVGFNKLEDLDNFVVLAGKILRNIKTDAVHKHGKPEQRKGIWRKLLSSQLIDEQRKAKFHGTVRDIKVTVLPPDSEFVVDSTGTTDPRHLLTILVQMDLYSTGRGKIGQTGTKCTLQVGTEEYLGRDIPFIKLATRPINPQETVEAVQQIIQQSSDSSYEAKRRAYMHTVSGGLPGLGKRR